MPSDCTTEQRRIYKQRHEEKKAREQRRILEQRLAELRAEVGQRRSDGQGKEEGTDLLRRF
jgi:hypothetical protein